MSSRPARPPANSTRMCLAPGRPAAATRNSVGSERLATSSTREFGLTKPYGSVLEGNTHRAAADVINWLILQPGEGNVFFTTWHGFGCNEVPHSSRGRRFRAAGGPFRLILAGASSQPDRRGRLPAA